MLRRRVAMFAAMQHGAVVVALVFTGFAVPLTGQTITLNVGDSARVFVAPNAKLTVPVSVDLTAAGALNLASLQAGVTWGASRLTFDSIRVAPSTGFTLTSNPANAASGNLTFNAFSATALAASGPLFNLYFTAGATSGGTRVALAPTVAATDMAQDLLNQLAVRSVDVCVATRATWGDVNDDGQVNVIDAQQIARYSVGLAVGNPTALAARGDVTADGAVNIIDAQQIARFSVALSAAARVNAPSLSVAPVAAVAVAPAGDSLVVGQTVGLSAALQDSTAASVAGCYPVTWTSSDTTVAKVSSAGLVTAVAAGTATITATSGGLSAHATVTAFALGDATQVGTTGGVVQAGGSGATISVPAGALASGSLLVQLKDSIGYPGVGRPLADRAYMLSITPIGSPTWGTGQNVVLTLPITQAPAAGQTAVVSVVVAGDTMWFPASVITTTASAARVAKPSLRSAAPSVARSAPLSPSITSGLAAVVKMPQQLWAAIANKAKAVGVGVANLVTTFGVGWMSTSDQPCDMSQYPSSKGGPWGPWLKDPAINDDLRHHPQQTPISGNVQVVLVEGLNRNVGDCTDFTRNGTRTEDYFAKLTPVLQTALGGTYALWAFSYPTSNHLSGSGNALAADLEALHSMYPSSDLVIVAHSMGGLVSRLAAGRLDSTTKSKLKGIITLGTPHLGAPLAYLGTDLAADPWALGALGFKASWGMDDLYAGLKDQLTEEVPLYAYAGDIFGRLPPLTLDPGRQLLYQLQTIACLSFPCRSDGIVPLTSAAPSFITRGKAYPSRPYDHFELSDGAGLSGNPQDPLYLSIINDIKTIAPAAVTVTVSLPQFSSTPYSGCALDATGRAWCSGHNSAYPWFGQTPGDFLGDGQLADRENYGLVAGGHTFSQLSGNQYETCGLESAQLWCWGMNAYGNFGDATSIGSATPRRGAVDQSFRVISVDIDHACGIDESSDAYCWGAINPGDFEYKHLSPPTLVSGGLKWRAISAGYAHACGIAFDDRVYCWGSNTSGELGPSATTSNTPVIADNAALYSNIGAAMDASCGLTRTGAVNCWGKMPSGSGYLSDMVASGPFTQLSVGALHACALDAVGTAFCWGNNASGAVGTGDASGTYVIRPTAVAGVPGGGALRFRSIVAGFANTCARTFEGDTYCWGNNSAGNLGDGTVTNRWAPVEVTVP